MEQESLEVLFQPETEDALLRGHQCAPEIVGKVTLRIKRGCLNSRWHPGTSAALIGGQGSRFAKVGCLGFGWGQQIGQEGFLQPVIAKPEQ